VLAHLIKFKYITIRAEKVASPNTALQTQPTTLSGMARTLTS